jgi:integrase/recombinase XerD
MNGTTPNTLGRALRGFFSDHLPRVRGASCQTVQSYRDTFVLLLRFVAAQRPTSVTKLDLEDLGPQVVLNFLHYLEVERHNIPATRNVRLAAIHAFFRYCAAEHPDRMELCQRILAVPFKRARSRSIEYLEFDEIQAVLTTIDRNTVDGRRDYALLATMFNTGARVQEIVSLRIGDVRFDKPRRFVYLERDAKNVFAHYGRKPPKCFVNFWQNAPASPLSVTHCSVIAMAPCSLGSVFAIS